MADLEKAQQLFREALALQEKGDLGKAERLYVEALTLAPERPSIMNNLAAVYIKLKKYVEAKHLCERLLQMNPEDEGALINLGSCQMKLNLAEGALLSWERVLKIRPNQVAALTNRAPALLELGRAEEALASCEGALAMNPDSADALNNRGNALLQLGRDDEANASFERAIILKPSDPDGYVRYGNALLSQHRLQAAIAQYERALDLAPDSRDAQFGLAGARLYQQDFERAWPGVERRFEIEGYGMRHFRSANVLDLFQRQARWRGPGQEGVRQVAIWAEQGIGDQVMFSTLIPDLIGAGVPLVYEVDQRLLRAYERAFPGIHFVAKDDPPHQALQSASHALAAESLLTLFRRSRNDFSRQPARLLSALPERVAFYRRRLDALQPGLKVGLTWFSSHNKGPARRKSTSLAQFAPLFGTAGVQFLDMQYGDTSIERNAVEAASGVRLLRFDDVDYFKDLEEVLAILEACDLLITTSNATAHFAGALGKPAWIVYPAARAPFHYWVPGPDGHSLWYPSVEIVSGPQLSDWRSVIEHAAEKLKMLAEAR